MKNFLTLLGLAALATLNFTACDDEGPTVQLPQTIQTYLDTNYPNAEVEESEKGKSCTGIDVYEVELEVADDETIDLTFNTEGALLFTEKEIENSALPSAVTASITENYPNHTLQDAELLDMADGSKQYEVKLKSGNQIIDVLFEADGTKVCEETGDDGE